MEPVYSNEHKFTGKESNTSSSRKRVSPQTACWLVLIFIITTLTIILVSTLIFQNDKTSLNKSAHETNLTDLTDQLNNLIHAKLNLEAENQKLKQKIQELLPQNGSLRILEAEMIGSNASRAQWSIDTYCPLTTETNCRTCKPCEKDWYNSLTSCYAVRDPDPAGRRNWEEAQNECNSKGSHLVVVADDVEKESVRSYSWFSSGENGYWVGLRAEAGNWKWVDGSDLTNTSWVNEIASDGQCVIYVKEDGWKAVSCDTKQRWICEKAALSV